MIGTRISGWGKHLPSRIVTNDEMSTFVETSDEWIRSRTGIEERRFASDEEGASTLGAGAAQRALECAGLEANDIDLIICATATPDRIFPSTASLIQAQIGASRAAAFDLGAACSGFIYGLVTARQFVASGLYRRVLVVGSEVYSRILDFTDRRTCVLFGDGAGAVVVEADANGEAMLGMSLGSDGRGADLLYVPCATGPVASQPANGHPALQMNGQEVFRFGVNVIVNAIRDLSDQTGIASSDVDLFVCHQANQRILKMAAKQAGIPFDRFYQNLHRYGNTSAASIPLALTEAVEEGYLKPGARVVVVGMGGGLSWGSAMIRWGVAGSDRVNTPTFATASI